MQLELFNTDDEIACEYCGSTATKKENKDVFYGFYDKDLERVVCFNCRKTHYEHKMQTEYHHRYTEIPIQLNR